jgi:hypothetical protein
MNIRTNRVLASRVSFGIGAVCILVGLVHMFAALRDITTHSDEVPPILFLGIFWPLFALLLSRDGTVWRFAAFLIGTAVISFFPMVLATALFHQGPLLVAIGLGVCAGSAVIAARLAFSGRKPNHGAAGQAS